MTVEEAANEVMKYLARLGELWPEGIGYPGDPFTVKFLPTDADEPYYITVATVPNDDPGNWKLNITVSDRPPERH